MHKKSLYGKKTLEFEHVMDTVLSVVNVIPCHRLFASFNLYTLEINAEYGDVFYRAEVRWLSHLT
jgi:hypothetical protein